MINRDHSEILEHAHFERLGFNHDWLDFLSVAILDDLAREIVPNEDPNPGHFKWKVFSLALQAQHSDSDAIFKALYRLAEREDNLKLRDTLICAVIRHAACPTTLLEQASDCPTAYIAEIARQRRKDERS